MQVAMFSRDSRRDRLQVPLSTLRVGTESNRLVAWWRTPFHRTLWFRKVGGRPQPPRVAVVDAHRVRRLVLVIEQAGKPSQLRSRRRGGVSIQLVRQMFLQPFDGFNRESCGAPENVHAVR